MMIIATTLFGKIVVALLRVLGNHGSALPGLLVEKINHKYLNKMLSKCQHGTIIILGTNGKTTTSKIVRKILTYQGLKVFGNESGSNFVRGVISHIISATTILGKFEYDVAVVELDEAHARHFTKLVQPRIAAVMNISRDQLDRYGEIDQTFRYIEEATANTPILVVNIDDSLTCSLSGSKETVYFGVSEALMQEFPDDARMHTKNKKITNKISQNNYVLNRSDVGELKYSYGGQMYEYKYSLNGYFNKLNALVAIATASQITELNIDKLTKSLQLIQPAFGRGELVTFNNAEVRIQLVKNPIGFRHALSLVGDDKNLKIIIAINDNYADGQDVSWLYDVDFRSLKDHCIYTSGTRAGDMAIRLGYSGIIVQDAQNSLEGILSYIEPEDKVLIFTTYTAMLQIRSILKGRRIN